VACIEGETFLNPLVRCGGDYQLMVSDTVNGCSSASVVRVDVDEALPVVIPYPDTSVNCARDTLLLVGEDISRPHIDFGWEEVLPLGNQPLPEISPGVLQVTNNGAFRFFIRDTLNGCENDFTVNVTADLDVPVVSVSAPDTFFCALDSLLISGTAELTNGRNPILNWVSETGFFVGNADAGIAYGPDARSGGYRPLPAHDHGPRQRLYGSGHPPGYGGYRPPAGQCLFPAGLPPGL